MEFANFRDRFIWFIIEKPTCYLENYNISGMWIAFIFFIIALYFRFFYRRQKNKKFDWQEKLYISIGIFLLIMTIITQILMIQRSLI